MNVLVLGYSKEQSNQKISKLHTLLEQLITKEIIQCLSLLNLPTDKPIYNRKSLAFSDWKGNPLFRCENVALKLNRMLRATNVLLCQIQFARKILLSGNSPKPQ